MAGVHEDFGEKIGGAKKDLWKDRGLYADDLEAMNEREAEKFVKKLLFVLGAPTAAGAIVQIPDAAVQKQHTQRGVQPTPVRKIQIHGGPFPAVNPHYGSSFRKRQDKEGLPQWRCRR